MPNYDLHKAAREGTLNQLPLDSLTPDAFLVADDAGLTPMHLAAYFGHLDQIPSSVFANEAIGLKYNDDGDNFYDVAANAGHLDQIPAAQRLAIVRGNGLIQLVGRGTVRQRGVIGRVGRNRPPQQLRLAWRSEGVAAVKLGLG